MKKLNVLFIILAFTLSAFAQTRTIVGKWAAFSWSEKENVNAKTIEYMEFFKDFTVVIGNEQYNLSPNTYKLNIDQKPQWIDITSVDNFNNKATLFGLMEWIDINTIKFEIFDNNTASHPIRFSNNSFKNKAADSLFVLRRLSPDGEIVSNKPVIDPIKSQLVNKWNVYPWTNRFDNAYKTSDSWLFKNNNKFVQTGSTINGIPFSGLYDLNTSVYPYWLDFYNSDGEKVYGLFEFYGRQEIKVEIFPSLDSDVHPTQFTDANDVDSIGKIGSNIYILKKDFSSKELYTDASEISGIWEGIWTKSEWKYGAELSIKVSTSLKIEGAINWTLLKSPNKDDSRIGKSGIEYISGNYSPSTRTLNFDGIKMDDPNIVISLDTYRLFFNDSDEKLFGQSKGGTQGNWEGQIELKKYGDKQVARKN